MGPPELQSPQTKAELSGAKSSFQKWKATVRFSIATFNSDTRKAQAAGLGDPISK